MSDSNDSKTNSSESPTNHITALVLLLNTPVEVTSKAVCKENIAKQKKKTNKFTSNTNGTNGSTVSE